MKNKIYQWLWYKVVRNLIPMRDGERLKRNHWRITAKLHLARLFGPIHGIMIGDSEIATFDEHKIMSKFSNLVINIGVGGTTPIEWYAYFMTCGNKNFRLIKSWSKAIPIFSIGGNCCIRCQMLELPESMQKLRSMFHDSWIMLVPPVHANWLAKTFESIGIQKSSMIIQAEMSTIRAYQRQTWQPNIIDTYTPFLDPKTGEPIPGILRDAIHFSEIADNMIEKVINKIV